MARHEDIDRRAQRAAQRQMNTKKKYGDELGGAFIEYFENGTPESRALFATAVAAGLRSDNPLENAKAIEALLQVIDGKIASVAEKAERADFWTQPIR